MQETVSYTRPHPQLQRLTTLLPTPWAGELQSMLERAAGAEELRMRAGAPLLLRAGKCSLRGRMPLTQSCLEDLLLRFCEGSVYAHRETICRGFVTLRDGCRVGVCGRATVEGESVRAVSDISSLCLRLPGELPAGAGEMAEQIMPLLDAGEGGSSVLICAPPGAGKTTLLRALALRLARPPRPRQTAIVDSRCELTPHLAHVGGTLDLLTAYPRHIGIEIAVRTLGAEVVLCDEIGSTADAGAILNAAACGVPIVATAHGRDVEMLAVRPPLQPLFAGGVFGYAAVLQREPGAAAGRLEIVAL